MDKLSKRLKLFEGKRAQCFENMQSTYNLLPNVRDDKIREQFVNKAQHVDKLRSDFIEIMDEINLLNMDLNESYEVNMKPVGAFDDLFCAVKSCLRKLDIPPQCSKSEIGESSFKENYAKNDNIRIPRIDLPTFDGDIRKFPFFYETFKRIIHENPKLTDSERVHYLFNHLTGKANSLCAGVVPAAENYSVVWEALIKKYYDHRTLATTYLNKLFSLKPVDGSSVTNLEKLIDEFSTTISALQHLKIANLCDFIFVHLGLKLLDSDTAKSFEMSIRNSQEMPEYDVFIKFVREQVKILYRTSQSQRPIGKVESNAAGAGARAPRFRSSHAYVTTYPKKDKCCLCHSADHTHLYRCNKFLDMNPSDRFKYIKENSACVNCLSMQHRSSKCRSQTTCRICNGRHHSLLHFDKPCTQVYTDINVPATSPNLSNVKPREGIDRNNTSLCTLSATSKHELTPTTEILPTAKVSVVGRNNKDFLIRCLLDPGSQKHYITTKCCNKIGLNINNDRPVFVQGIGGASQPVKGRVNLTFSSRFSSEHTYTIEALVLDEITTQLPTCQIDSSYMDRLHSVPLADDMWFSPGRIDLLIGVKLFAEMLLPGKITNTPGLPDALETVLGYIVLGNAPITAPSQSTLSFCATHELENTLKKFWEIENLGNEPVLSLEDKHAEEIYKKTFKRHLDGRYEVALPFKLDPINLGNSFKVAERRALSLERKFVMQPQLRRLYDDVINEHLNKGYLSRVDTNSSENAYYIPHHAVLRLDKSTTKLRVVLDASAKTDSGMSLNDILHVGPSLQADLFNILLNMRLFPIAISADVRQMYLCIDVREEDRRYQRILYRFKPQEPLTVYQYNRVAFGLRCSPYLALRTVQQLNTDVGTTYPMARDIVSRDVYMDDIVSSIMNEEQAATAAHELIDLFKVGGFQLAKWSSNSASVLQEIPEELRLSKSVSFDDDTTLKILGLRWYPAEDIFAFEVFPDDRPCTKRNMLSAIARLFDVLGLVAPIILYAKLLIKKLWSLSIGWDDVPPENVLRQWQLFTSQLPLISNLKFPRHVGVISDCSIVIVGFADASEKAYGGVVYICVNNPGNRKIIRLVCAKSKVAPLKIVSLARLELCAALLLSELIKRVLNNYSSRCRIDSVVAFSDSTVVLSWIHSSPHRWQTFVANRIAKIQENLQSSHFYHVKGTENPSDCLSRGLTPKQLLDHSLWLEGPPWLRFPKVEWPIKPFVAGGEEIPELKHVSLITATATDNIIYNLSKRFSSWNKYVRSVVYLLKFVRRLPKGPHTARDLEHAEAEILRALQREYFFEDILNLKLNKECAATIRKLNPFLDKGLIRVGGRLVNSRETYDYKHPVLLPRRDHIVNILIDYVHYKEVHAGPEALMSLLRHKYWIISARSIIRTRIHQCIRCFRLRPRATNPMMGNLPSERINPVEKVFSQTGCDYAGPVLCTPTRRRGVRSQKAYLCLFTCLTTRAVHIEVATDLSTASFISAFKRFLARRGPIKCMHSDNGTNFVGAKSYIRELHDFLAAEYKQHWEQELAKNRIEWKLIPPHAPHFGGCWESNVKCMKTHLFRTIGQQLLSYDELITVVVQIEALLNSRPLTVLSSDASEPLALTPAHFLNVAPLKYFPAAPVLETVDHLLPRYQLLDKIVQSFWNRWRGEYLHTLQCRQKWNSPARPIVEGTVVVIIQENVMPLHWPLGLIVKTYPGTDGIVRVAAVKTKNGLYRRPIVKLCPLPTQ